MDHSREEVRLTKAQLSELKSVDKRLSDVINRLHSVKADVGRKIEQLSECITLPPSDVSEYGRARERCRPPDRTSVDAVKSSVDNLLQAYDPSLDEVRINPMTVTPRRVTTFSPRQDGDRDGPFIRSVIAAQDGRLVMADWTNMKVKTVDIRNPGAVLSLTFKGKPWGLALLHDGLVAVTLPRRKSLQFVDVSGRPSVRSRVQTVRKYYGVSAGTTEDTLIVSCDIDNDGPAAVDIVTRDGRVIRTVTDSNTLSDMSWPHFLCLSQQSILGPTSAQAGPFTGQLGRSLGRGNVSHTGDVQQHLLISELDSNKVFRVELASGRYVSTLKHRDIRSPRQVTTDQTGNIYIACVDSRCVIVVSAEDGQYRRLLEGRQHRERGNVYPDGVCITGSQLVVARSDRLFHSVVSVYELS